MIPLRDVIPSRTTPVVTTALIAINALVFFYQWSLGPEEGTRFIFDWGLIPAFFSWLNVLTSMFLHGGFLHAGGNMLYLWIFGDNVEDRLGHARFVAFYLFCGVAAALAQAFVSPSSRVPMVGASGAIAGVMGAYFVMYPHSRVLVLMFLVFYINVIEIPAVFFLAFWFFMQVIGGLGRAAEAASTGGVAFWAHAGGFAAGALSARFLRRPDRMEWASRDRL